MDADEATNHRGGLRLEVLTLSHLESIRLRPDHAEYVQALGVRNPAINAHLVRCGGVAMVAREGVVACAGVNLFWEGMAQLWMRVGCLSARYPFALAKRSRRFVAETMNTLTLRRLQAVVLAENLVARRFIGWLGFTEEGLMHSYGPEGGDYILYARVKG